MWPPVLKSKVRHCKGAGILTKYFEIRYSGVPYDSKKKSSPEQSCVVCHVTVGKIIAGSLSTTSMAWIKLSRETCRAIFTHTRVRQDVVISPGRLPKIYYKYAGFLISFHRKSLVPELTENRPTWKWALGLFSKKTTEIRPRAYFLL